MFVPDRRGRTIESKMSRTKRNDDERTKRNEEQIKERNVHDDGTKKREVEKEEGIHPCYR